MPELTNILNKKLTIMFLAFSSFLSFIIGLCYLPKIADATIETKEYYEKNVVISFGLGLLLWTLAYYLLEDINRL